MKLSTTSDSTYSKMIGKRDACPLAHSQATLYNVSFDKRKFKFLKYHQFACTKKEKRRRHLLKTCGL